MGGLGVSVFRKGRDDRTFYACSVFSTFFQLPRTSQSSKTTFLQLRS